MFKNGFGFCISQDSGSKRQNPNSIGLRKKRRREECLLTPATKGAREGPNGLFMTAWLILGAQRSHEDSSFCLPSTSLHSHACSPCVVTKMTLRTYSICLEIPTEEEYIFFLTHRKRTKITSHLFAGFGPIPETIAMTLSEPGSRDHP